MSNLSRAVNESINAKGKVRGFRFIDTRKTYRVVKMMAEHWKCDVRTAYRKYADYLYG